MRVISGESPPVSVPGCAGYMQFEDRPAGSYWLELRAQHLRQAFEIQDPADQVRLLSDTLESAPTEATQAVPVLALAKEFLDLLAAALRQLIAQASPSHADARVRALAPARLGGDMRRDPLPEQRLDEGPDEEALVGAERRWAEAEAPLRALQQGQAARRFRGRRAKDRGVEAQQQPMAILNHRIDGVARVGAGAGGALRDEATVRVGQRAMGRVAPRLPTEVHGAIARILRPRGVGPILGSQPALVFLRRQGHLDRQEALVAGVGTDQGAIRADVPTHEPFGHRPRHRLVKQPLEDPRLVEAPTPILTERRGIPRLLVEVEAHKPAQGHVALQLHDELPVAGDAQEVPADQGEEQLLGRNRRPPDGRVAIATRAANGAVINKRSDRPQRLVGCG